MFVKLMSLQYSFILHSYLLNYDIDMYDLPLSFIKHVEHGDQKFIFTFCGIETALPEVNGVF